MSTSSSRCAVPGCQKYEWQHCPASICPYDYSPEDRGHGTRAEGLELIFICNKMCEHWHQFLAKEE